MYIFFISVFQAMNVFNPGMNYPCFIHMYTKMKLNVYSADAKKRTSSMMRLEMISVIKIAMLCYMFRFCHYPLTTFLN